MKISITYMAQLKTATGTGSEEVELPSSGTTKELVHQLVERHGESLGRMLLDSSGELQPTILLFVNDSQVAKGSSQPLQNGDKVTFLSPIAGGSRE